MDSIGLVTALMAAKMAQVQYAIAAKVMKASPDGPQNALSIINAAEQNGGKLAAAAQGLGQNVDISV
jgi:hypothetical protein